MTEATRFYSVVAPKNSDRPYARQLVVGDEWHPPEGEAGDVQYWNGTAWADKLDKKTAAEAEKAQRDLEEQKQRDAGEVKTEELSKAINQKPAAPTPAPAKKGDHHSVGTHKKGSK